MGNPDDDDDMVIFLDPINERERITARRSARPLMSRQHRDDKFTTASGCEQCWSSPRWSPSSSRRISFWSPDRAIRLPRSRVCRPAASDRVCSPRSAESLQPGRGSDGGTGEVVVAQFRFNGVAAQVVDRLIRAVRGGR